ncbi:MAG TPA: DNA mismatch repair endonuclease MutL [Thermoanaerobaculia bacterium]|jgi:DNA mismatch repair protein MutL|nr:DNA mismatch repair endonuclease MutL [Thermoanaerobaculia bacterium]
MSRIHLLPDTLVSQIAAGEVVERPASVVKELVENALDAGAGLIEIQLESGGKGRIAIGDDGWGMGRDDALLAFDRHATSKIASFDDLERVATLGFRGEALATVAAVARVEMTTAEQPGEGHRVLIEGGRVRVAEPFARPRGTTIDVRSLFFNVPARRKFLKAPQTELRRCVEVVQGYALARPDVRFQVSHEGRELLDALPAPGTAAGSRERIGQIFGLELARELAEIPAGQGREEETIHGFVGTPATARGRRHFIYVNHRLIRDRAVLATFYRAVRDEWKGEDFPALFLFLDIPPEEVDVNVHPQKAEVRFRDPGLLDRIYEALRRTLERARGEEAAPLRPPASEPYVPFAWQGLGEQRAPVAWDRSSAGPTEVTGAPGPSGSVELPVFPTRLATPSYAPLERPMVPLSGRHGEARPFRLLGQYKGTLIMLEGPDGLYLIDQHVAHERILYERLRRAMAAERPPVQHLLTPVLLDLAPAERLRLSELASSLEEHGFGLTVLSGNTLALTSTPGALSAADAERLLRSLAADSGDGTAGAADLSRQILENLAASMACKAAVKMHHPLSAPEMEALVAELFTAEQPYACPHGRPIVLQMTDSDLERRFGRR